MKKNGLWIFIIVILSVCGYLLASSIYKNSANKTADNSEANKLLIKDYSPSMGPSNAKVVMVEFLDPECESCRAMAPMVGRLLVEYEGKIRYILRYMPLHPNSVLAISYLEGAREQGKYWEALAAVFNSQPEWGSHENPRPDLLPDALKNIGLNMDALKASVDSGRHLQKAEQDKKDGNALGVYMTPTFFINGKKLDDISYQALKNAIIQAGEF